MQTYKGFPITSIFPLSFKKTNAWVESTKEVQLYPQHQKSNRARNVVVLYVTIFKIVEDMENALVKGGQK